MGMRKVSMVSRPFCASAGDGADAGGLPKERMKRSVWLPPSVGQGKRGQKGVGAIRELEDTGHLFASSCQVIAEIGCLGIGQGSLAVEAKFDFAGMCQPVLRGSEYLDMPTHSEVPHIVELDDRFFLTLDPG